MQCTGLLKKDKQGPSALLQGLGFRVSGLGFLTPFVVGSGHVFPDTRDPCLKPAYLRC